MLSISVIDGDLFVIEVLLIIVIDINDVLIFISEFYSVSVVENDVVVVVYIVSVIDEDSGDFVMFILFGIGSIDFLISLFMGVVILICVLDFEIIFVYYFIIRVGDLNGDVVMISLNVIIVDQNDLFQFVSILYSVNIGENFFVGIIVINVFVIDDDFLDMLIYSLFGVNSNYFNIGLNIGVIIMM